MTNTMLSRTIQGADQIGSSSRTQSSVALQLQNYCNSVLEQPLVDFSGQSVLAKLQQEVNDGLGTARSHADLYLGKIQPSIITNITNISNYFALHNAIVTALPAGSSTKDWLSNLAAIKEQADEYTLHARGVVISLSDFHRNLTGDVANFSKVVSDLNVAVHGDNGVLASIDSQLNDMQGKIDGAITGIVLSGLAITAGVFIILVGAIADFVTAGTSTPVVVGGVAVVVAGIGGEVASSLALAGLLKAKGNLIAQQSSLKAEVNLALGISKGYAALRDQAGTAVQAATSMQNAWQFLGDDLGNLSLDLQKGISSPDAVRKLFLMAADGAVKTVITDTDIIKRQMTGVQEFRAPKGKTVDLYLVELAKEHAA
jgi:hypothetical protein